MRRALITLALLGTTAHASPMTELADARDAFRAKDCARAMPLLSSLFYPRDQLAQRDDLVEAHAMLGACKADGSATDDAKAQFRQVLRLQPDKTLGELLFSATAIRVFEETRRDLDTEEKAQAEARKNNETRAAVAEYLSKLVVYEKQPYWANFLPLGAGQFFQKRYTPAFLFATGEVITGSTTAGIWLYLVGKYGITSNNVALADGPRVRELQQIEIVSGVLFIGLYIYQVVDALRHYKPRIQVKADDSLLPPDLRPTPAKKTSLRDRMHFGPIVSASGLGIGFSLESD